MTTPTKKQYKLSELIHGLDATIKGDPHCLIEGICPIEQSQHGHITFLTNSLYRKFLADTKASAVILTEADVSSCSGNAVISSNPHFTYAKIAEYFVKEDSAEVGIHPTAVIGENCEIPNSVAIGPHCVVGNRVKLGDKVILGAGSFIGNDVEIGDESQLDANVSIYHDVKIGKRARIASGVIIGSEGFGFANNKGVWHKVPQLGGVKIGDDVDIGANTAIDRGTIENTIIEDGVKLDNLIQIGHNVQIGANTIMAGCSAIAGSAVVGKNCMIGGKTAVTGHITIADKVMITGGTHVTKSIREPGLYSSGLMGIVTNEEFRKNCARFNRLEHLISRVKALESALTERNDS